MAQAAHHDQLFGSGTAQKLKVAASLHRKPMKDYIQNILEAHLKELEAKGITLALPKGK